MDWTILCSNYPTLFLLSHNINRVYHVLIGEVPVVELIRDIDTISELACGVIVGPPSRFASLAVGKSKCPIKASVPSE
jgi:hypothetical protein